VVALAALGLVLPALVVRGPVVRWLVARATRPLCGTIEVDGGHAGWLLVFELLGGRPLDVELRGVKIQGADGREALFLDRVSGAVTVSRNPWRLVVDQPVVEHGRWRLSVDKTGGLGGFLGVFRPAPGGSRAACLTPPAPRRGPRPPGSAPGAPSASFAVHEARLDDVDVELDFPVWGLSLLHASGIGALGLGTPGGPLVTFDVRDVRSTSGVLRVGPGGPSATTATTTASFNDVLIARVGVSPEEPSDIALEVGHADTGRSRLAGKAVFENVFAHHGRRGQKNPPGLLLDARWERLADAAARVDAPWLPREALGEILDGTLAARVHGPFMALSGTVSLQGPRGGFEATVENGDRATLDVRANDLALEPFLHESLRPLLGGRVTGQLRMALELSAGFRDAALEIPTADMTLTRAGADPDPPRIAFRVGAPAATPVPWSEADDALVLGLSAARFAHHALRVEGLSARWAELSARGALTLELPAPADRAARPAPRGPVEASATDAAASAAGRSSPARLDAKVALAVTSLARWVPPATATARVVAEATLSGPLDHLRARLAFAPSTTATILGERFRAPGTVTATIEGGRALALDGLAIERVGGGRVEARGRAERGGPIAGQLRISRYPLSAFPGEESVDLPAALAGGHPAPLREALGGRLDATLVVAGAAARPTFSGKLDLEGVSLAGRPLGDGHLRARAHGWSMSLDGTLGPALALVLDATKLPEGVKGDATLKLDRFALGPWMPPPLAGLDLAASGTARVDVAPRRPLVTRADVRLAGAPGEIDVRESSEGETAEGTARGRLELAPLRPLWRRALAEADGALALDLASSARGPVTGTIAVARALTLRPAGWPLAVGVAEGGRVDVDGTRLHVPGVTLTAAGAAIALAGDVRVDAAAPERSSLALTARGHLDAAALARQARLPELASASGMITIDARATGAARAPEASGTARLEAVELHPSAAGLPPVRLDGLVEARGSVLSTRSLRVEALGGAARGAVSVGAPDAPASVDLEPPWPPRVARLDVPVAARGLRVGDAKSAYQIGALDLHVRLVGDPARELVLSGDVGVAGATFDPFAPGPKKKSSGPPRPWFEALPPRLTLDLDVHGPAGALSVDVPVLPDVYLGLHCHVAGSARGGSISGQLRGSGAYSRLMLALFAPKGARECRVLKE
jgi:hypothetical protein